VLRSPGQPLDAATRVFMEPRFGHNFSRVRVHTDARAAESARAVGAAAYTVGYDIVFGEGQFEPGTRNGRQLLAHELTHVVQQRGAHSPRDDGHQVQTLQRVPDENGGSASGSDLSSQLGAIADDMETVQAAAAQRLASAAPSDQGNTGDQQAPDSLTEAIAHIRAVADGSDESLKQQVLDSLRQGLAQADSQIVPAPPTTPQAGPIDVSEQQPESLAASPLEVGRPRDAAEVEAERVSVLVAGGASASVAPSPLGTQLRLQRQAAEALATAGADILALDAELAPAEATNPVGWATAAGLAVVGLALIGTAWVMARTWKCFASCNVEGTEPQCTGRVTGFATGSSQEIACREAKRDATQKAPRGCYARHCQCNCSQ
jgi:hypothetical protein